MGLAAFRSLGYIVFGMAWRVGVSGMHRVMVRDRRKARGSLVMVRVRVREI